MLDDDQAVEQARRGDEAAWRYLYERHVDLVFHLALRAVGDRDGALDVVQEAFVRAARGLDGFREEASFRSWIARIAINESRTWLRRRARRREISLERVPGRAGGEELPDAVLARQDLARRALEFVRTLPEQQRDVILLRTSEGYSYREIAEMLGTTEGSARVSYHHGMAKLREHLAGRAEPAAEAGGEG
ncbi:MAG: RNA polymerase sigma factor [Gemmatimonadota bacterium]